MLALLVSCTGFQAGAPPPSRVAASEADLHTAPAIMMPNAPFTVPKAYRVPTPDVVEWVDGYQPLYEKRLLYLGQEIDDLFGAAIKLGMAFLPPEAFGLGNSVPRHADFVQGFLHLVELEWLDDRFDLFHLAVSPREFC